MDSPPSPAPPTEPSASSSGARGHRGRGGARNAGSGSSSAGGAGDRVERGGRGSGRARRLRPGDEGYDAAAADRERCSKSMSMLLRHKAPEFGLVMRSDGYVRFSDFMAATHMQRATEGMVDEIVRSCPKQRFGTMVDGAGEKWIRANQGHTLTTVDPELLLTPIVSADEAPIAIHGTYLANWPGIKATGLKRMARQHVHFAAGEIGESGVISGLRSSAQVYIYLDVGAALAAGMKVYRSANNVILTSGVDDTIPVSCFAKVVRVSDGTLLWPESV